MIQQPMVNLYPPIKGGISVDLNFKSAYSSMVLTERVSDYSKIEVNAIVGSNRIALEKRKYWSRASSNRTSFSVQESQEFKNIYGRLPYTHCLESPILKNNREIQDIKKVLEAIQYKGPEGFPLCLKDSLNITIRIHNTKLKTVQKNTWVGISKELNSLFKQEELIKISSDRETIEVFNITAIEEWYDLRNTIFLIEEIVETVSSKTVIDYSLDNLVTSHILQEFLTTKKYYNISVIEDRKTVLKRFIIENGKTIILPRHSQPLVN